LVNAGFVRRTQVGTRRIEDFEIRRPRDSDHGPIRDFLTGLSPRARYLRFFSGAPPTGPAMLRVLAGGGAGSDVLVAAGDGVVIGHGMAADRTGPGGTRLTEIGVVVADGYRGRGVGSALVRRLVARAEARGTAALVMEILAENRPVLTMVADHWPTACQDRSGGYVTISAPLWPVARPYSCGHGRPADYPRTGHVGPRGDRADGGDRRHAARR
jgi:GNAT superfamily N-acetyltransferase